MPQDFSSYTRLGGLLRDVDDLKAKLTQAGIEMFEDQTGRWYIDEAIGHLCEAREALRIGRAAVDPRTRTDGAE